MHGGTIDTVLFVHGYSVTDLRSFNKLPELLAADGIRAESIYLAGFVSLDDMVSCEDLALALEHRVSTLEARYDLDLSRTILIAHSTGAIIARRWILDRRRAKQSNPAIATLSHFMSCAGSNHGSTMAQLGLTELAHVYRSVAERKAVGKRVLEDLDYGSIFLRQLNRQWLDAWNDDENPLFADTFCFSIGGTDHSFWQNHLFWQSHESGSDGTVRVSGANLNYRWITIRPEPEPYRLETLDQPAPHLVIDDGTKRYSHISQSGHDTAKLVIGAARTVTEVVHGFGNDPDPVTLTSNGIVEGVHASDERPYKAFEEAMTVQTVSDYAKLATAWCAETDAWSAANPAETNSTIVITIADESGRIVDNSFVVLRDTDGSIASVSRSILRNQPIRNKVTPSIVSVYVNFPTFEEAHPHSIHLDANTSAQHVTRDTSIDDHHVIGANEFSYIDVEIPRDPTEAFAFYRMSDPAFAAVVEQQFPPFDPRGRI
jgi:hypothetical protein